MSEDKLQGEPTREYGTNRDETRTEYREALRELTPFQTRFVEAGLKTGNWTEAARLAGSQAKNLEQVAWNTRQIPAVQKALALGMEMRIRAAALDDAEVIMKLREVFDAAMDAGKFTDANKAAELLGKSLGLFLDAKSTDGKIASRQRELMDERAKQNEQETDDSAKGMLSILGRSRLREGTAADPRNITDLDRDVEST